MKLSEDDLAKTVADFLRIAAPDLLWWHVANEATLPKQVNSKGQRYSVEGRKRKTMGVRAGVADLQFILTDGRSAFIELKAGTNTQSKAQEQFEVDPLWRKQAFARMQETPNLLYLLLSKRIGNAIRMCDVMTGHELLPENAALGATMIDQSEWDRDMPKLREAGLALGARFTFASVEPMLGPIGTRGSLPEWVICGGESGPGARPMHPDWARSLRDQCRTASIPFFFKQWGEWVPWEPEHGPCWVSQTGDSEDRHTLFPSDICDDPAGWDSGLSYMANGEAQAAFQRVGKKAAGRTLDGVLWNEFPDLRGRVAA